MKMIGTFFIAWITVFCFSISVALAGEKDNPDSAGILKQADNLFESDDFEGALDSYKQAAEEAEIEKNNSVAAEAYSQIARCCLKLDRMDEGKTWLEKASQTASEEDPLGWSRYLGVRGRFEWKDSQASSNMLTPETDKASKTFKEMYDHCIEHELPSRVVDAANMVAITGRLDERVEWSLKGIEAAEKGNLSGMLGPLWNNLGWTYDNLGRYDESLKALEKARYYHYLRGEELPMLIADWSVGHALRMTGQIDSAETVLSNVQKWAFIKKSEEKSPENSEWVGWANLELAEIVLQRGDRDRGLGMLKVAYRNLFEAGMRDWDPGKLEEINLRILEVSRSEK